MENESVAGSFLVKGGGSESAVMFLWLALVSVIPKLKTLKLFNMCDLHLALRHFHMIFKRLMNMSNIFWKKHSHHSPLQIRLN